MIERSSLFADLHAVGLAADDTVDLADVALQLAALDQPDTDIGHYRGYLRGLTVDLNDRALTANSSAERRRALRDVLVGQHGFRGDAESYDDMQNANLMRVIDRRRGLPVALAILYLHAARAQGWKAEGLNVPAHLLVRVQTGGEDVILDPFNAGRRVGDDGLAVLMRLPPGVVQAGGLTAMTDREVLIRLQNNIKVRALQRRDIERALAVLESMRAIDPRRAGLWWEAASIQADAGTPGAAIKTLEAYLAHPTTADPPEAINKMLSKLRRMLN
jgi:regulator of sirC expression with transglutaminase-like and TPR domain